MHVLHETVAQEPDLFYLSIFFAVLVEITAVAANTRREDQDTRSANVKP